MFRRPCKTKKLLLSVCFRFPCRAKQFIIVLRAALDLFPNARVVYLRIVLKAFELILRRLLILECKSRIKVFGNVFGQIDRVFENQVLAVR